FPNFFSDSRNSLLEKGLLLTKELPSAETRIVLEAGEKPGTANLALKTEDRVALDWGIDYNNFGSELIGKDRYGTKIEITDPWWGSTLALRGVTGNDPKDSSLTNLDLTIPSGLYATSLNLRYLDGSYIVGQELADLGLEGSTQIYGLSFLHPLLRTRNQNMTLSVGYDNKYTKSFLLDEVSNIDDLDVYHFNLDFDSLDRFLGKNLVSVGYYFGRLNLDSEAPFTRPNADHRFHHYNINLARIQKIYGSINVIVRGSGQKSNDNLLPVQEVAIGGYGTVRGHETSLFLGDSGYSFSAELLSAPPYIADKVLFGQRIGQMMQLATFYDYGRAYYTDPQPGDNPSGRLAGYGAGIRLYYKDLFSFKFDIGFPTREKVPDEDSRFLYFTTNINFTSKEFRLSLKKLGNWMTGSTEGEAPAPSPAP
ncbi:ShlB/FhaC/HecB family hemolysin secretion/activation protein, partial [Thermodesulfobacteriota bacterium]